MSLGFDFPQELEVVATMMGLEFKMPDDADLNLYDKAVADLINKDCPCLFRKNQKNGKYQILKGKKDDQVKTLIFLLEEMKLIKLNSLPFSTEVICFFRPDFDPNTTREAFEQLNDPLLIPFMKPLTKMNYPNITTFISPIYIGSEIFQIIVNALGSDQQRDWDKVKQIIFEHAEDKFVIKLAIPTLFPVGFCWDRDQNCVEATFADFDIYKVDQIKNQFQALLNTVSHLQGIRATFDQCDEISTKSISDISQKIQDHFASRAILPDGTLAPADIQNPAAEKLPAKVIFIAAAETDDSSECDVVTTNIYAVVAPGIKNYQPILDKFQELITQLFNSVKLIYCKNCHSLYCQGDNSICMDSKHTGKQIAIDETGELEVVDPEELDSNGEPLVYVNWTCCGEVPKDEPCKYGKQIETGHIPDDEKKLGSTLKIEPHQLKINETEMPAKST